MTTKEINEYNKKYHYLQNLQNLIRKSTYHKCLFANDCTEPPINAHSISRAILSTFQQENHVIQPSSRNRKDDSGRSYPAIEFKLTPITRASTGKFACETHDKKFQMIDTTPMDFDNPKLLDLLFFRAMLKEVWALLRIQKGTIHLEQERGPIPTHPGIHPDMRLRALLDAVNRIRPFIDKDNNPRDKSPVTHIVRSIKTSRPFVATSSAGGSLTQVFDMYTGQELSMNDARLFTCKEPNGSWSFTIIPQANDHVVVVSFLKGSQAEHYFSYLKSLNGRELTAAISADLILFCENWFLHPKIWKSYGSTKQKAIATAFDNFYELHTGKYNSQDIDKKEKWHAYTYIPNRHQINLFIYDESKFPP